MRWLYRRRALSDRSSRRSDYLCRVDCRRPRSFRRFEWFRGRHGRPRRHSRSIRDGGLRRYSAGAEPSRGAVALLHRYRASWSSAAQPDGLPRTLRHSGLRCQCLRYSYGCFGHLFQRPDSGALHGCGVDCCSAPSVRRRSRRGSGDSCPVGDSCAAGHGYRTIECGRQHSRLSQPHRGFSRRSDGHRRRALPAGSDRGRPLPGERRRGCGRLSLADGSDQWNSRSDRFPDGYSQPVRPALGHDRRRCNDGRGALRPHTGIPGRGRGIAARARQGGPLDAPKTRRRPVAEIAERRLQWCPIPIST